MTDHPASDFAQRGQAFVRPAFDPTTIFLHWTMLALVLAQFATALSIDHVDPATAKLLLAVHRSTGLLLWILVAFRLVWRFTGMRLPPFPPEMTRPHIAGVHLSENGLYGLLLAQPVTGLADTLLRGRAFDLVLWRVPTLLERNRPLAGLAHTAHEAGAWMLACVVSVHAAAALFHHFVRRDGILQSMAPIVGGPSAPSPETLGPEPAWPDTLDA